MKPKCFSDAGLPPQNLASKSRCAFRSDAGNVKTTAGFLGAQSLGLGIEFSFCRGNCTTLRMSKALVTIDNRPIAKLCGGACGAVALFSASGIV